MINLNLNPISIYKSEKNKLTKIEKMINIKDNQFLVVSTKSIFLFKYI